MLFQASNKHLFRLDKTIFIGDDPRDCQASWNAYCRTIFLGDLNELKDLPYNQKPDFVTSELGNSLDFIRKFYHLS